jgi:flagellar basal-body rod protein FlgC
MSVFDTIRAAASGLTAQRLRMDVAASNIANAQSTRGSEGGTYERQSVVFAPVRMGREATSEGVAAVSILSSPARTRVYDPTHPDADDTGFVNLPDVDIATEMTDMMGAARAYQVNATVVQAAKQTALDALELGRR